MNGALYDYELQYSSQTMRADAVEVAVDPLDFTFTSVSSGLLDVGEFFTSLTHDDVGGLTYLLSPANRNVERLPSGVYGVGGSLVDTALRPGVDRMIFRRLPLHPVLRQFQALTNRFVDHYVSVGGGTVQQTVERVVRNPDILFAAGDLPSNADGTFKKYDLSSTSQWVNYASLNSGVSSNGPGVIGPGIVITFNRDIYNSSIAFAWGSFDGSTNAPRIYPTDRNKPVTIVPVRSQWRYLDNGSDQGTAWRLPAFNDSQWRAGRAKLGYGDGDELTTISFGTNANDKHVTTYFRHAFVVSDPSDFTNLTLRILRDDGVVVYLNGVEVFRSNMPFIPVDYRTFAIAAINGTAESTYLVSPISPRPLLGGTNVLAVELHQVSLNSSDVGFDVELSNAPVASGPVLEILRRPVGMLIRWPSTAEGYDLYVASAFNQLPSWTRHSTSPSDDGTWKSVLISPSVGGSSQFYKLLKP